MKIFIIYDRTDPPDEQQEAITDEYGLERRAADVIDGDQMDCLVIWRSIVGERGDEQEVVRVSATGVYEHISAQHAQKFINMLESELPL